IVKVNERQLLRVDPLVLYYGLLGHLRSSNRKTCEMDMELWLVEGQECLIIPEDVTQINIWLKDLDRPVEYEYFVTEILYSFNGGVYLVIGNMPLEKIVNTLEEEIWIAGGLGYIIADLPQGNDLAGVLQHNANYDCRTCIASSSQLTNSNFDFLSNAWFHHLTNIQYNEIAQQKTDSAYAYHALSDWKNIKKPARWSWMPNPLTHRQSFTFSDTLHLAMLILFILHYFLLPSHFKIEIIEHLKNIYQLTRNNHAIIKLIELWVVKAKLLKLAFLTTMTSNTYKELRSLFEKEQISFLKIFPDVFKNLPNIYISIHLLQHVHTFATLVNTSVGVKDMKIKLLKFYVGDIIEIEEESEGLTYAKIQTILQHQANNTESAIFVVLKWLQETNTKDLILDCPYYKQIMNDQQLFRIYLITCINHVQKIHFLPIQNNQKYIKNEFYYEAV
ncbi:22158_t:CDS:2, partial [Gigaspora margarita]